MYFGGRLYYPSCIGIQNKLRFSEPLTEVTRFFWVFSRSFKAQLTLLTRRWLRPLRRCWCCCLSANYWGMFFLFWESNTGSWKEWLDTMNHYESFSRELPRVSFGKVPTWSLTASLSLKSYHPKRKIVFQPSIFRGYVKPWGCKLVLGRSSAREEWSLSKGFFSYLETHMVRPDVVDGEWLTGSGFRFP